MNDGGGQLEQEGLFLPEEHRGELELDRSRGEGPILVVGLGLVVACALMVAGGGGTLTWIGGAVAMALFVLFAWLASRSIDRQSRRVEELLEE